LVEWAIIALDHLPRSGKLALHLAQSFPVEIQASELAGQHISVLKRLTTAAILPDLQGPVKVRWNPPMPTTIDQHKPIMAAAN